MKRPIRNLIFIAVFCVGLLGIILANYSQTHAQVGCGWAGCGPGWRDPDSYSVVSQDNESTMQHPWVYPSEQLVDEGPFGYQQSWWGYAHTIDSYDNSFTRWAFAKSTFTVTFETEPITVALYTRALGAPPYGEVGEPTNPWPDPHQTVNGWIVYVGSSSSPGEYTYYRALNSPYPTSNTPWVSSFSPSEERALYPGAGPFDTFTFVSYSAVAPEDCDIVIVTPPFIDLTCLLKSFFQYFPITDYFMAADVRGYFGDPLTPTPTPTKTPTPSNTPTGTRTPDPTTPAPTPTPTNEPQTCSGGIVNDPNFYYGSSTWGSSGTAAFSNGVWALSPGDSIQQTILLPYDGNYDFHIIGRSYAPSGDNITLHLDGYGMARLTPYWIATGWAAYAAYGGYELKFEANYDDSAQIFLDYVCVEYTGPGEPTATPTRPTSTPFPSPTTMPNTPTPTPITPLPTYTPQATYTPQPSYTPQPTYTPGNSPTPRPTLTLPPSVTPGGPTATPFPTAYPTPECMSSSIIGSPYEWAGPNVVWFADAEGGYDAIMDLYEYVERDLTFTSGYYTLTIQNKPPNAYTYSPMGFLLYDNADVLVAASTFNSDGDISGWRVEYTNFTIINPGTYRVRLIYNGAWGGFFRRPCFSLVYYLPTPIPTATATGWAPPTATSTPGPTPTGATATPAITSTPEPPDQAGFCDSASPPGFPPYTGSCGPDANIIIDPIGWVGQQLCKLLDLFPRLFQWLGWILQWLFCPIYDVFAWLSCLLMQIGVMISNLLCVIRQPFDFIVAAWNAFIAEMNRG